MATQNLIFDGNKPKTITYNGYDVNKVIWDDTVVWKKEVATYLKQFTVPSTATSFTIEELDN